MRLPPEEIFRYALEAGFSPDQAVTMTAISLAESGGNPGAHNPVGEDSIGLWQVNRNAHPQFATADGSDPLTNAQMAYEVSGGGADIGRWTVTHADKGAPYLQYRAQAEAAARANGHFDAEGQWDPPDNYYSDRVSAGPAGDDLAPPVPTAAADDLADAEPPSGGLDADGDGLVDLYEEAIRTDPTAVDTDRDGFGDSDEILHHTDPLDFASNPLVTPSDAPSAFRPALTTESPLAPADVGPAHASQVVGSDLADAVTPDAVMDASSPADGGPLDVFLDAALSQDGASYIFGAEVDSDDPDPQGAGAAFDCSELVEWAAARAGVDVPDGSYNQYLQLREVGAELTVDEALRTPGALVFDFSSEPVPGGGRPSGAHVAISLGNGELIEARGRAYGVGRFDSAGRDFSHAALIPELGTELTPSLAGLDGDVMTEALPVIWDSDTDGLIDAYEQLIALDPFSVDTDRDGFLDSIELSYGSDPLDFSNNPLVGEGPGTGYRPPLTVDVPPLGGRVVPGVEWEPPTVAAGGRGPLVPEVDPSTVSSDDELVDRSLNDDPADNPLATPVDQPDDLDDTVGPDDADDVDDDDDFYLDDV